MHDWLTPEYENRKRGEYERIRGRFPSLVTRGFECWSGWFPVIEAYFEEVVTILAAHPGATYELLQVKEKFAGLRLYTHTSDDIGAAVMDAYDRAANVAAKTCEVCGQPGVLRNRKGFFTTRCNTHADGGEPTAWDRVTG